MGPTDNLQSGDGVGLGTDVLPDSVKTLKTAVIANNRLVCLQGEWRGAEHARVCGSVQLSQ